MSRALHQLARNFLLPTGEGGRAEALVTLLRLRWFLHLRWIFVSAAALALALENLLPPHARRPLGLYLLIAGLAMLNLGWSLLSIAMSRRLSVAWLTSSAWSMETESALERATLFANAQIAMDLLFLTAILRFTGGVENPLAVFYLFHVVISALLLPTSNALAQSCWAAALYAALGIGEWSGLLRPHYPLLPSAPDNALHANGEFVTAAVTAVSLGIFGALYFTTQITIRLDEHTHQLRLAKEELERSRDAIRDLQTRRAKFMRIAAHQLKSPLAGVQILIQLIRDGVVKPDQVAETCDRVIARCREGIEHVTELLSLARVQEADPLRHRGARTDVEDVLRRVAARYAPLADEKRIQVDVNIAPAGDLIAQVEPRDLNDALGNLIDNAIKYTPEGGRVSIRANRSDQRVRIEVSDTGIGIDPPSLPHVFEEYRRGESALAAGIPGTGLGLSIVQAIATQTGGRLKIESDPRTGTTVLLELPC